MTKRKRRKFSYEELHSCWTLWRQSLGFSDIARALDLKSGTIFGIIRLQGGYSPFKRTRNCRHLSFSEREEISRCLAQELPLREISRRLTRSPSTISSEIQRNGGSKHYRANNAGQKAWANALRPKICMLASRPGLCSLIAEKMSKKWSPQQISGWLRRHFPCDKEMNISHETIYKSLYIQSRSVLEKELMTNLRYGHKMRQTQKHSTRGDRGTIRIVNGLSISERPHEVENRDVPGHWEGDLISGSKNSHMATLVERSSRYTMLAQLEEKDADSVNRALIHEINKLPLYLKRTLTWDRGMEMANHHEFSAATNMKVYFCDPQSPWQRGTNENTNRLLRQYFPKKTALNHFTQKDLQRVALELNDRPRKTLDFRTPSEVLLEGVAMTD